MERSDTGELASRWVIAGLTVFVFVGIAVVLFGGLGQAPREVGSSILPSMNALLNGTSAILLTVGYVCIRRRKVTAHKTCMLTAFVVSSLFLVSYLLHHYQVGSVPFLGRGWPRSLYFALLIPHVVLAAFVVPLALTTIHRGWKSRLEQHVRIARWTLPIWLYVSVSGVLLYWMLYHLEP
ncbi:MAG: DUF420 domain-containing protein [Acidobacteria bacterium]|nr:DUF420 domain-containing protein [Acidobacteriota bacterium]